MCLSVHLDFLDIFEVDMMKMPNGSNMTDHHTTQYNSDSLIVRRGQEFQVKVTFNRPYKPNEDKFALEFVIGKTLTQVFQCWLKWSVNTDIKVEMYNFYISHSTLVAWWCSW